MADEIAPSVETEDEKRAREAEEARAAAEAKRIERERQAMIAAEAAAAAIADAEAKAAKAALDASLKASEEAMASVKPIVIPQADEIQAPAGPDGKPMFGPNFATELQAAGVLGLPYSYDETRGVLMFDASIKLANRAKVVAVVEAHDPAKPGPLPPPPNLSDRQFGEGLWREGLITFDDYLAFIGPGTVPPPLLAIIDALPDDDTGGPTERKTALGLVTGAQTYEFANPLVDLVRQKLTWTVEHLRERWAYWATL